jgi:hypothetical protein
MKKGNILRLIVIVPLLVIALYAIVSVIIDMKNPVYPFFVYLIFLFIYLIVAGMMTWALIPILKGDRLLKVGEPASATVLQVWDTGLTVNEFDIQVGLLLEVRPPGQSPYQTKTKTLVSRIQPTLYQPGMEVQVRYDPKNPDKVTVEGIGSRVKNRAADAGMMTSGTIIHGGQTYTNIDDLPPEARSKYQQAMSALADKDGDGIPDILQGGVGNISQKKDVHGADPAEKLRVLEQMLNEDLITRQEYDAKKAEILSRI